MLAVVLALFIAIIAAFNCVKKSYNLAPVRDVGKSVRTEAQYVKSPKETPNTPVSNSGSAVDQYLCCCHKQNRWIPRSSLKLWRTTPLFCLYRRSFESFSFQFLQLSWLKRQSKSGTSITVQKKQHSVNFSAGSDYGTDRTSLVLEINGFRLRFPNFILPFLYIAERWNCLHHCMLIGVRGSVLLLSLLFLTPQVIMASDGFKVRVGNVPYQATEQEVGQYFSAVGEVNTAEIVYDKETGRPRGLAIVTYADESGAQRAVDELNGQSFNGNNLIVSHEN
ncbi:unnamed protein product [Caenorhabditis auriculariae]|uniref:RRM domain-containing protein n=1 Tax=Caenorhabditis auriculariae TaxID=2777116 RepID=A0A8S1GSP8_9PELO|nr:unnamed protein product [Caenorhabditis auriculariae]